MDKESAEEIYNVFAVLRFSDFANEQVKAEFEKIEGRYCVLRETYGNVEGAKLAFVQWLMERF
jgi:hypothetical protein